jgi:hypothetical protein
MVARIAVLLLAVSTLLAIAGCDFRSRPPSSVFGNTGCRYGDSTYAHGTSACQSGTEYRCNNGQWSGRGTACAENLPAADKSCDLDGHSYSAGSASCQSGTQYRCDDGAWRNLAVACARSGDGSERRTRKVRSCIYNGATFGRGSSICRAGISYSCEDSEWRNLGTACQ